MGIIKSNHLSERKINQSPQNLFLRKIQKQNSNINNVNHIRD